MSYATISATLDYATYSPSNGGRVEVGYTVTKTTSDGSVRERVDYKFINVETNTTIVSGTSTSMTETNGAGFERGAMFQAMPAGTLVRMEFYLKTSDDSYTSSRSTAILNVYTPPAPAQLTSYDWDEVRRSITIKAKSTSANSVAISAGYAPNDYTLGTTVDSGDTATYTLKDLNHGTGQVLYISATPQAYDGYAYEAQSAKISIPIPNPIIGVYTPACDKGDPQYIVDIVEKKADCSVTKKWQNGDRVYRRKPCGELDFLAQENHDLILQENNSRIIVEE